MPIYPGGLPLSLHTHWDHPWTTAARNNKNFRSWLNRHGYLTPHFRISEAKCKNGVGVPKVLIPWARNHAFNLEKLRHALGDRPLPILSWYRTPAYNRQIGGARFSQHMTARATDFDRAYVERVGRAKFFAAANRIWASGGVGSYPSGSAHVDSRGVFARWSSYVPYFGK